MKREEFKNMCRNIVLLDGATGSNLLSAGMPRGVCTESWILSNRSVFQTLQKNYLKAGSQILLAPTFGCNRFALARHGLEGQLHAMNRELVRISKDIAGPDTLIAGDISPTGKMMEPAGDLTYTAAFDVYCEQISCLAEAGVDYIAAETMISIEEALAAIDACRSVCDLPITCTVTVEADGSIFSGGNAAEAAAAFESAGADAVGVNCSVGPDQLTAVIRNIRHTVSCPVIAKPNAGMPDIDDQGNALYSMGPSDFAVHMKALVEAGATLIGGCCGTTPEYIAEMARLICQPV